MARKKTRQPYNLAWRCHQRGLHRAYRLAKRTAKLVEVDRDAWDGDPIEEVYEFKDESVLSFDVAFGRLNRISGYAAPPGGGKMRTVWQ